VEKVSRKMVPLRNENSPNGENNFSEKYEKTTEKK
jgi:hypothetical protein